MKYNQNYEILQVSLNKISINNLYEKNPIVLDEQVYDVDELLGTLFKFSYIFKTMFTVSNNVNRNPHKYLMLFADDKISIKIINPKYKKDIRKSLEDSNVQYVTIKLKPNQILILPALWYYHTDNMDVRAIGLDDLLSKFIYKVF